MKKETLLLENLNCPVCAADLQRALSQMKGVRRAEVAFASGTVELEYKKLPVRPLFDFCSDRGRQMNATGHHLPVFSFVSNALWPPAEEGYEGVFDCDVVLFDGLEDRDMEGNWVF